jgi:23S rRNA (guanine745-N1)-methyltransferase
MKTLSHALDYLQCPLCSSGFEQKEKSLVCVNRHTYDLARTGYVNFFHKKQDGIYDRELFLHRRRVFEFGFFDEMISCIKSILNQHLPNAQSLVDFGCGEGSLVHHLNINGPKFGVDIAQAGIDLASRLYKDAFWIVGDLSRPIFKPKSMDIVLNVLTPANYQVFRSVLAPKGLVIKVMPGVEHLAEIRAVLQKENSISQNPAEQFAREFKVIASCDIKSTMNFNSEAVADLMAMTPLNERKDQEVEVKPMAISLDLKVMAGVVEV